MTPHEQTDPLVTLLGRLPLATSEPDRAERVKARCRARLRRRYRPGSPDSRLRARKLESVVIGGFSALYFAGLILDLLRWHNML